MGVLGSVKERHQYFCLDYGKVVPKLSVTVAVGSSRLHGIFDTGAESIVFKKGLPEKLGFERVPREVKVTGATGSEEAWLWRGSFDLLFDDERKVHVTEVILEADLPGDVEVLVGQPVIKNFSHFTVDAFKKVRIDI